jgi:diaminopimelate decarboxylase
LEIGHVPATSLAETYDTPLYVYDASVIRGSFLKIADSVPYSPLRVHYACVANANVAIIRTILALGGGVHANTWGDVFTALHAGCPSGEIIYSGSNIDDRDFVNLFIHEISVNLNSLSQLRSYGKCLRVFERVGQKNAGTASRQRQIGLRIHLEDRMPYSRMGVKASEIEQASAIALEEGLKIVGVHYYRGTGTIHTKHFLEPFSALVDVATSVIKDLEYLDVGGGFGYPYMPAGPVDFEWEHFGSRISDMMEDLSTKAGRRIVLILEPGRSVVAASGFLLTRVVGVDRRSTGGQVIGVDTTTSHISSETYRVYGGYRRVVLANRTSDEEMMPTDVVGCTTFSDDYIARAPRYGNSDRGLKLPPLHEGDLLAVLDAGGYGFAFASNFLNKPRPAEVIVDAGQPRLIRHRETYEDLVRLQVC